MDLFPAKRKKTVDFRTAKGAESSQFSSSSKRERCIALLADAAMKGESRWRMQWHSAEIGQRRIMMRKNVLAGLVLLLFFWALPNFGQIITGTISG
ncbi:MAG: hypothetical protein ACRD88_17995, partial [Terriglobia bacterium]